MIDIIEIDIGQLGVRMPRSEVGIVIAQPFVDLVLQEPFPIKPEMRDKAIASIDATLAVSLSCVHGADKTHFTVFPECTLPGLEGFDHITKSLMKNEWPTGTIVIGGLEGISRTDFSELVQRPNANYDTAGNSLERIREDQWVNCCVTWAKLESGEVFSWIQPKVEPAWVERNVHHQSMFKGRSVFLFKGTYADTNTPFSFSTLICFDWIGAKDGRRIWEWLLESINQTAGEMQASLPLTWLFVAQYNPAPSHPSFMSQIQLFFNPMQFPNVVRDDTFLIMANVAGKAVPGVVQEYGGSAVISSNSKFMKPVNMPTYCNQRPGNPLENFKDAMFRENGACVHSFRQLNPSTLPPGAAGRQHAIAEATVHPLSEIKDPRTPSRLVPAVVKWVNDELDDPNKSLGANIPAPPLATAIIAAHRKSVTALRWLPPEALIKTMLVASPRTCESPDQWNSVQTRAVKHLLNTFSILDVAQYPAEFHGREAQATIVKGDLSVEVVAVIGRNHEECDKHIRDKLLTHRGQLLLISRDEDNTSWNPRMRTIFDQASEPAKELDITDPTSAFIRVGYQDILKAYNEAANNIILKDAIDAAIS